MKWTDFHYMHQKIQKYKQLEVSESREPLADLLFQLLVSSHNKLKLNCGLKCHLIYY